MISRTSSKTCRGFTPESKRCLSISVFWFRQRVHELEGQNLSQKQNKQKSMSISISHMIIRCYSNAWPHVSLGSTPVMFWHLTRLICQANQVLCSVINGPLWRWNKQTLGCQMKDMFTINTRVILIHFLTAPDNIIV